jgi:hypothetical protein
MWFVDELSKMLDRRRARIPSIFRLCSGSFGVDHQSIVFLFESGKQKGSRLLWSAYILINLHPR